MLLVSDATKPAIGSDCHVARRGRLLGYYCSDILHAAPSPSKLLGIGCNIKGNISINTGERIYHVPGQKFYDETVISPRYGERWFCSEAEARSAGWRKARR